MTTIEKAKPKTAAKKSSDKMTAAQWATKFKINPKVARAKLRANKIDFVGKEFSVTSEVVKCIKSIVPTPVE